MNVYENVRKDQGDKSEHAACVKHALNAHMETVHYLKNTYGRKQCEYSTG